MFDLSGPLTMIPPGMLDLPTRSPSILSDYYKRPLVLSHSSRGLFHSCPRKYEFTMRWNAGGSIEDTYAADCGTALHMGVQDFVANRNVNRALSIFILHFPFDLEQQLVSEAGYDVSWSRKTRSFEACAVTFMCIINSFNWDRYQLATFDINGKQASGVELSCSIKLLNTGLPVDAYFMMHIDLILIDNLTGELVVFDIKTTRDQLTDLRWRYDQQTIPYGLVIQSLQGQVIENVTTHYLAAYIDILEPQTIDFPQINGRSNIAAWLDGLTEDLGRIHKYMDKGRWPRPISGSSCLPFRKPCRFAGFCDLVEPETIAEVIPQVPRDDFYDPTKADLQIEFDMAPYIQIENGG